MRYYRTGLFRQPRFHNTPTSMLFPAVRFALLVRPYMSGQGFLYGLRLSVSPHRTCTVPQVRCGLIRLPKSLRFPYLAFRVHLPVPGSVVDKYPMHLPMTGTLRASQVPDVSLHTHRPDVLQGCHALSRPRQTLGELTKALSLYRLLP